jgi:hypothetical protein
MKSLEADHLRNVYMTLQVNAKLRRLYLRDVKMYMKVTKKNRPPLPIYRDKSL